MARATSSLSAGNSAGSALSAVRVAPLSAQGRRRASTHPARPARPSRDAAATARCGPTRVAVEASSSARSVLINRSLAAASLNPKSMIQMVPSPPRNTLASRRSRCAIRYRCRSATWAQTARNRSSSRSSTSTPSSDLPSMASYASTNAFGSRGRQRDERRCLYPETSRHQGQERLVLDRAPE